jgi:hypothetical protein
VGWGGWKDGGPADAAGGDCTLASGTLSPVSWHAFGCIIARLLLRRGTQTEAPS